MSSELSHHEPTHYELKPIASRGSESNLRLRRTASALSSTSSYQPLLDDDSSPALPPAPKSQSASAQKLGPFRGRFKGRRPIRVVIALISMVGTIVVVLTDVFANDLQNDVLNVIV